MIRALALLLILLLPACVADDTAPPDRPQMSQADQDACTGRGGIVSIAGMLGGQFCAEPLPDAGQACTRASDCTGLCMSETRTCQTHANPFGCNSFLDENGDIQTICAD